jgi:AsmA protein
MLESFKLDTMITGPLSLSMDVKSQGSDWDTIVSNMKGSINLSGKNLIFYGMDADKVIDKFKRSQNFNLVDLGAVILAGPVGIAVTKGSDFATLLIVNPGESSQITNLVSNWELKNGDFIMKDAAFTTTKNRIATTGSINFSKDSLNLTIALLNKYGCSVFSQNIYGNLNSPTLGKVKVVGTILAPVTNLVDDVLGNDCDVFYNGSVKHPTK